MEEIDKGENMEERVMDGEASNNFLLEMGRFDANNALLDDDNDTDDNGKSTSDHDKLVKIMQIHHQPCHAVVVVRKI